MPIHRASLYVVLPAGALKLLLLPLIAVLSDPKVRAHADCQSAVPERMSSDADAGNGTGTGATTSSAGAAGASSGSEAGGEAGPGSGVARVTTAVMVESMGKQFGLVYKAMKESRVWQPVLVSAGTEIEQDRTGHKRTRHNLT